MMQICYKDTTKYRIWLFIRLFFYTHLQHFARAWSTGDIVVFSREEDKTQIGH